MAWKAEFYSTKVEDTIAGWPKHLKAKFLKIVELIEKMGPTELGMPYIRPLKRELFEIRAKSDRALGEQCFVPCKGKLLLFSVDL